METKRRIFAIILGAAFIISMAGPVGAATLSCEDGTEAVSGICVPKSSETGQVDKTASEVIESVIKWMLGIAGVLAIAVIVSSGLMYVTSAGDKDRTNRAQQTLTYAIIGLIVVLIAYSIVTTVANTLLE